MTDNHPTAAPDPRPPSPGLRLPAALIFDMDGVMVDSNPFHLRKWEKLLNEHGIPFDLEELPKQIVGHRNGELLRTFFGPALTAAERHALIEELEEKFRVAFKPHAEPLPGLRELIVQASEAGIAMAVASSAMRKNVEFVVDALGLRPYFRFLLNGDEVTHAKPDPEIYLKAAGKLGFDPGQCVAFEDSFVGIEAVKNAGMKCVAIGSSFPLEDLRQTRADRVVASFLELDLGELGNRE
ncbi:MAG: HAD family hydrolase [Terriglobia bacterium]